MRLELLINTVSADEETYYRLQLRLQTAIVGWAPFSKSVRYCATNTNLSTHDQGIAHDDERKRLVAALLAAHSRIKLRRGRGHCYNTKLMIRRHATYLTTGNDKLLQKVCHADKVMVRL
ncbi:hypothetical protein FOIG_00332 [Fusarium odoratissimum NRRL 54006]|uniref:Uncharacterized protein n=2 Tax=Fusarium oxysporum species complex TaxID=171631 RepID=X0KN52_FUSO5|nr:uncharacterized protein FOIG_00332 [Fusarium odoratissimum NRRL 54006]EXM10101.1 hypothetical protein FOIG_00332 [Fusarium odoratissimum NRRL 54006]TXC05270.1 hypothetical protein FocTR4_00001817 [Fusarium oxysporum f. sp. cubense]